MIPTTAVCSCRRTCAAIAAAIVLSTTAAHAQQASAPATPPAPTPGGGTLTGPQATPPPTPGAVPQTLVLGDAVTLARRNVPAVLAAMAQSHVADAQLELSRATLRPTVTGNAGLGLSGQNGTNLFGGTLATFTTGTGTATAGVTVRWTIWDFGRTALNVDAADLAARAARRDIESSARVAVSGAATAYYAVLADQELVSSAQETLHQRERELEIARGRVQSGTDPPINQTRAEIAVQTAQLDLTTAQASVANDAAALAAALALDPARPVVVSRPGDIAVDDDPGHAADNAALSRPEVLAAHARVISAQRSVDAAEALYRPSLVASATGSVGYTVFPTSGIQGGPNEAANGSLSLQVPIFDPTIRANVLVAQGQLDAARANEAQAALSARQDAVQAALAVRSARQALLEAERLAAQSAANLALAEGRYAAGAAQLLELVDAQAQDATARLTVIQRRFQFESAKVRLLAAIGQLGVLESRR
jgi:outer membrane protein